LQHQKSGGGAVAFDFLSHDDKSGNGGDVDQGFKSSQIALVDDTIEVRPVFLLCGVAVVPHVPPLLALTLTLARARARACYRSW
jgi:hypothetical protein